MITNSEQVTQRVDTDVLYKLLCLLDDTPLSQYDYIYICARNNGKKIKGAWFDTANDVINNVRKFFREHQYHANAYGVEMLYDPENRLCELSKEYQWNSLRGIRAIVVDAKKNLRCSALQMISENKSFIQVVRDCISKQGLNAGEKVPVLLFKTKQFFVSRSHNPPVVMFRGNQIVKFERVNSEYVKNTIYLMITWLGNQVREDGSANYKYWPSRRQFSNANNPIRQWMATICLNRCALAYKSTHLQNLANRNISYNLENTFKESNGLGYIWMNGTAKLGALSLAALAILESPLRKQFLTLEYKLRNTIYTLSNPDGSFDTFLIPRWRKDNQNFYSGEALLFLARRFSISKNPCELERIMSAFRYYRNWHLVNRNPAFVPWHTQAYFLVWQVTKEEELKNFIFEMNDWLLPMQQWESAEFPDMQGRFYDPTRPHFGPPHASSTGVYLEGLIDAFSLAKQSGDSARAERYRIAIVRGIRSLMQLQYKGAIDCFYIEHVDRVLGGVRTTVYDNTIRIDNVQHGLMALLKIINRFSEQDYQLDDSENQAAFQKSYLISPVHSRTSEAVCPEVLHRDGAAK